MSDMSRENNMEEILSSIRRVMSRDDDSGAAVAMNDDAILELTDTDDDAVADASDDTAQSADTIPAVAHADIPAARSKKQAKSTVELDQMSPVAEVQDTLIADPVAQVSRDKLSALSALIAKPQEPNTPAAAAGTTVDALVREALRPLLKDWLDANLPDIVEAMVAREIARITGRSF